MIRVLLVFFFFYFVSGVGRTEDQNPFVVYSVRTYFGGEIARSLAQQLLIANVKNTSDRIGLVEERISNGTWKITVFQENLKLTEFSYSLSRLDKFPSAEAVARFIVRRLSQ